MNGVSEFTPTGAAMWAPRSRSVDLTGPAGRLEALLNTGAPDAPFAALVCHPHPLYGGAMHNKVVYNAMKVLNAPAWGFGYPVLRFNFRGTGLSQGKHDGNAEVEDVLAAMEWLDREFHRPLIVAGFSFGAAMAVQACCAPSRPRSASGPSGESARAPVIQSIAALGLPIRADGRDYQYRCLREITIPKLFLSGNRDEFAPSNALEEVVHAASDPKELIFIPDSDHFFTGKLEQMQNALAGWIKEFE